MKILSKFTLKNLVKNKKRTIVTIIGAVLSVTLLFSVGIIASTLRQNELNSAIEKSGDYNVKINNTDNSEKVKSTIENDTDIDYFVRYDQIDNNDTYNIINASYSYEDNFVLSKGRLPENENEVIVTIDSNISIGTEIETEENTYKVVGIYKESKFDHYVHKNNYLNENHNYLFTKSNKVKSSVYYIYYKNMNDTIENTYELAETLNFDVNLSTEGVNIYKNVFINTNYLRFFGIGDESFERSVRLWVFSILTVLAIFSYLAISNSFAISAAERKKTIGIFRSLGASKLDIFLSVLFEAFIVAIISIPIGILLSIILLYSSSTIIEKMLFSVGSNNFNFDVTIYNEFLIFSLGLSIAAIFFSALIPAIKSSKVSPMEAIRLNNELKLKKKKVKKSKGLFSLFGEEAIIAKNTIKRNSKKYRSAKVSLIISIVLFMVIGHFINYVFGEVNKNAYIEDYPIVISVKNTKDGKKIVNEISSYSEIDDYIISRSRVEKIPRKTGYFIDDASDKETFKTILVMSIDSKNYKKFKEKYNVTDDFAFVTKNEIYNSGYSKDDNYTKQIWNDDITSINLYFFESNENYDEETMESKEQFVYDINNPYYTFNNIKFIDNSDDIGFPSGGIIVSDKIFDELEELKTSYSDSKASFTIKIKSDEYKSLDSKIKALASNSEDIESYSNYLVENEEYLNTIKAVKMGIYAFLIFIILIAVSNIINTINTNMDLRKRDFAVLRSVGLSESSFNKMLLYEGVILGFDSLIWGQVIANFFIVLTLIANVYGDELVPYPFKYLIASIIGVYLIIFITMYFASRKIKKSNIIETIRNENV